MFCIGAHFLSVMFWVLVGFLFDVLGCYVVRNDAELLFEFVIFWGVLGFVSFDVVLGCLFSFVLFVFVYIVGLDVLGKLL